MNVLVLGCGSIGKRHIRNLVSANVGRVVACDVRRERLDEIKREMPVDICLDLDTALEKNNFDAGLVCTPPAFHVPQARRLLESGIHCFIEKPLSHSLAGVVELKRLSEEKRKAVVIGYPIRFSPMFKRVKKMVEEGAVGRMLFIKASVGYYLPFWRPDEDYRQGYASRSELGGGVVLDASHEIDYVRCLAGEVEGVYAVCKKLSGMEIDTEDFAEIMMTHANGVHSQIHLDYLQTNYRRGCEIVGEKGMIVWDINGREIRHAGRKDREYHTYYEGLNAGVNEMYVEELEHFFRCVQDIERPCVGIEDGARVQEIIMRIKESSDKNRFLNI